MQMSDGGPFGGYLFAYSGQHCSSHWLPTLLGLVSDRWEKGFFEDLYLKFKLVYFHNFFNFLLICVYKQISVKTEQFIYYHYWSANASQQNRQTACVNI